MTPKQQVFCDEYLIDLNATKAYIRAGYSPKGANVSASQLLAKPSIRAYVDVKLAERSKRTGISADRVLEELAKLGFVDPKKLIDFEKGTVREDAVPEDTAAISSVKVKTVVMDGQTITEREVRLADKTKPLELLGKHLGVFNQDNGDKSVTVHFNVPRPENDGSSSPV